MSGAIFVITVPKKQPEENIKKSVSRGSNGSSNESTCASRSSYATVEGYTENCKQKVDWLKHPSFKDPINDIEKQECDAVEIGNNDTKVVPAEQIVLDVLKALNIFNAAWSSSYEDKYHQIIFDVSNHDECERALCVLRDAGIGTSVIGTSFSVIPSALHFEPEHAENVSADDDGWDAFVRSVSARQTVYQVVQQIKKDATITFDFVALLIVAAIVAAMGLVENSTMFLVASMLISPLMSPITAGTFATAIRDRDLFRIGVLNELFGLSLAMLIGFLFGLIVCLTDEKYGKGNWPTEEMLSRCDIRALWVGVLIAIPSGATVAISVLSDNTSSLVGVAISASLLPPAVNAGLFWGMSFIQLCYLGDDTKFKNFVISHVFSDMPAIELAVDGLISLSLTLINIVCIYFAGIIVYLIKEVAPMNSHDFQFWKHDIKAARNCNRTFSAESGRKVSYAVEANIENKLGNSSLPMYAERNDRRNINQDELFDRLNYVRNNYMTWSPNRSFMRRVSVRELQGLHKQLSEDNANKKLKPIRSFSTSIYKKLSEENIPKIVETKPTEDAFQEQSNYQTNERFIVAQVHEPKI